MQGPRSNTLLWIVFGVILFVLFALLIPAYGDICEHQHKANPENCSAYGRTFLFFSKAIEGFEKLGVALTALATILLFWATRSLVIATKSLASISAHQGETSKAHERAYLSGGPDAAAVEVDEVTNTPIRYRVRISATNFGRTPAMLKEVRANVAPIDGLPAIPVYPHRLVENSFIKPQETYRTKLHAFYLFAWTEQHVLTGILIYEDVFRKEHRSRFILRLRRHERSFDHINIDGHEAYKEWD